MASTPLPFRGQTACGLKPPLHLSPGASGEFVSHAIRPRSGHHVLAMTVMVEVTVKLIPSSPLNPESNILRGMPMTVVVEATVKLLPSSQRKLGSSVFRRAPVTPVDGSTSVRSYSQIRTLNFRDSLIKLTQSLLRIQSQPTHNRITGNDTGIRITPFI